MDTVYFGRQAEHCPGGRLGLSRAPAERRVLQGAPG